MGFLETLITFLGLKKKVAKVICVGLDNSGKTTIINHLKPEDAKLKTTIVPTIGFTVEVFTHSNISFTTYDMSGQGRYRKLWEHYYKDVQAIIYVIDSSDKLRMPVVKDELDQILQHPDIRKKDAPLLVLANKMDLQNSLTTISTRLMENGGASLMSQLKIELISQAELRKTQSLKPDYEGEVLLSSTNALTGEGLDEAVDWLTDQVKRNFQSD